MGVKLTELIPKKQIEFKDLANKKIAVDFSNSCYQFLSSIRQIDGTLLMDSKGRVTSHLMGIWTRFSNLIMQNVKLAIVFDGRSPLLKLKTQEARTFRKEEAAKKFKEAKAKKDTALMYKYARQTSKLTYEMIEESKELIKALGLPLIQAPSEADAQMAFMNEKKDVWACATSDTDPLLHSAPRLITNLTISQRRKLPSGTYVKTKPELVELKQLLKNLKINQDQLIVIAILVGTDYNQGIKGIGSKTALKLVHQYKSFDKIFREVKAEFNWKKIYAIFKSMPVMKNYQLNWKDPDPEKIKKILVDEHDFSAERVDKTLTKLSKEKPSREQIDLDKWTK